MLYSDFKNLTVSKNLNWQHEEFVNRYDIWAWDGLHKYETTIYKSNATIIGLNTSQEAADLSDFETNYKPRANMANKVTSSGYDSVYASETTTSTNSNVSARPTLGDFDTRGLTNKSFDVVNNGSNAVLISFLASTDGINFVYSLLSGQSLAGGQTLHLNETGAYQSIRIMVRSSLAGLHSSVTTRGYAAGA